MLVLHVKSYSSHFFNINEFINQSSTLKINTLIRKVLNTYEWMIDILGLIEEDLDAPSSYSLLWLKNNVARGTQQRTLSDPTLRGGVPASRQQRAPSASRIKKGKINAGSTWGSFSFVVVVTWVVKLLTFTCVEKPVCDVVESSGKSRSDKRIQKK